MPLFLRNGHLAFGPLGTHLLYKEPETDCDCLCRVPACETCTIPFGTSAAGFLSNNSTIPGNEATAISHIATVVVEVSGATDALTVLTACHCNEETTACSLICGDDNLLHSRFCAATPYDVGTGQKIVCGGTCASDGSLAEDPGGKVDGDACIHGNTNGSGSRPGICTVPASDVDVTDHCCPTFNRAWELLAPGTTIAGGVVNDCIWMGIDANQCSYADIYYDLFYDSGLTTQLCKVHGGICAIYAWVSKDYYPLSPSSTPPSNQLYWFAILDILTNNLRQLVLYRSVFGLPYVKDEGGDLCYDAAGTFQLERTGREQRDNIFGDHIVPVCDFPNHIELTATRA